ncbi:MAG: T9SS type A sorting domain-containing protein, partial [Ferruginibacter sp.]
DKLYLMNMVDITKGTRFSIVNSRFETGAGANVRTNHWGGGGSDPWQDPDKQDFEYTGGTAIAKGSIIAMESNSAAGFTNFSINGGTAPATLFSAKSGTSNFLSTTDADQLYITQGKFTGYGTATVDRYDLFDGLVIHGITTKVAWIPLSSSVSVSNTGGPTRQSRIPPDILCINTEFAASTLNYAYYDRGVGQTGTKNTMLGRLKNLGNWFTGAGSTADDIIAGDGGFDTNPYAISAPGFTEGSWTGNSSTDWFDCNNWEGSHVPDSTLSATIYSVFTAGHNCIINVAASTNAAEYQSVAKAADLTLIGSLSLTGTGKEILKVDDTLTISNSGNLLFENTANAINDTLYLNGSFIDGTTTLGGFTPGQGTLSMEDSRFAAIPVSLNKPVISPVLGTYNLNINNSRSITLITPITVSNILGLNYGYINLQSPNGKLTLNSGATINSPVNNYGFTNEGWEKSFVNGQLNYTLGNISVNPFPVGKIGTDTVFAPFRLEKTIPNPATYTAEYFGVAYSDLTVDIGDLRKVSELEHWLISSPASSPNGDAKVSLSWRPASKVGDGNPAHDAEALDSLVVAHYFNDGFSTEWHIDGHDHNVMPKSIGSTISYGYVTTNFYTGGFTAIPFTLGGKSPYNVLPLQLIDFTATPVQKTILLNWMTREEKNILHYEVEKSTDGRNFSWLGTENAVNSLSLHNYRLVDQNPAPGWNYYRLKVTDDHYKISYSAVVRVWMASIGQVIVYPNPAQKEIKIILPPQSSTTELSIVNSAGQVVKQVRSNQLSLTINIETLSSGLYFIYIRNSQQAIVQRFIKQ